MSCKMAVDTQDFEFCISLCVQQSIFVLYCIVNVFGKTIAFISRKSVYIYLDIILILVMFYNHLYRYSFQLLSYEYTDTSYVL